MLVGFVGHAGAGKTFSADVMVRRYHELNGKVPQPGFCVVKSFSEPIKQITLMLHPGWDERHTRGELKEVVDEKYNISPRKVQQIIGFELRQIRPSIWPDVLFESLLFAYRLENNFVAIDDVRTKSDFDAIKSRGGIIIGLKAGNNSRAIGDEDAEHPVESEIDELIRHSDVSLTNDYGGRHALACEELTDRLHKNGGL